MNNRLGNVARHFTCSGINKASHCCEAFGDLAGIWPAVG